MTTVPSSTMTTTLRIREATFQDAYDQLNRWPTDLRIRSQEYFRNNKERLMTLDTRCFRELRILLDMPEDPQSLFLGKPDNRYPDGYFYAEFYLLSYPILERAEQEQINQKCDNYLRILRNGELDTWIRLLNTANAALTARIEAGIEDSDDHREVMIMNTVWDKWKAE